MKFIADLHVHSRHSRATSRDLNLESLYIGAQLKGIQVLATGDATHPAWFDELETRLEPAEPGLYRLRPEVARVCDQAVPGRCRGPVRFVIGTEISNIYKKDGRTRKNHNLVFMPDLEAAARFNRRLEKIGNIHSDGRPILGLDARDLLEIVLETHPAAYLVPAHIWTPWFSMLGSQSGFDSLEQCFGDLSHHVFAAETGLSSDPPMNWRVSGLDRLTLISNSDAHSAAKLGREANRFDAEFSFLGIRRAMETGKAGGFEGTVEFFPQEGKYHLDGHRACGVCLTPEEPRRRGGICPVCHRPLTRGVLHRVIDLADRPEGAAGPTGSAPFCHLLPLDDILADVLRSGTGTKKVATAYRQALERLGGELRILMDLDREAIQKADIPLLAEGVSRMRQGRVAIDPGHDGVYGRIRIFAAGERRRLLGQQTLFSLPGAACDPEPAGAAEAPASARHQARLDFADPVSGAAAGLNAAQRQAVEAADGSLVIVAGPGTGKTLTLTRRIARLISTRKVPPGRILAVTFTRQAADALRRRIAAALEPRAELPEIGTFHGLCAKFLAELGAGPTAIADDSRRLAIVRDAIVQTAQEDGRRPVSARRAAAFIEARKQALEDGADSGVEKDRRLTRVFDCYQRLMAADGWADYDDLIGRMVALLESGDGRARSLRERFTHFFVDEFQDINPAQYRLVRALAPPGANLFAIGDPDQCIYGFRGSDPALMDRLQRDDPATRRIRLTRSYRLPQTILDAAGEVMAAVNPRRPILEGAGPGPKVAVVAAPSEKAEAVAIGRIIEQRVGGSGFETLNFGVLDAAIGPCQASFADFAVLFRTHARGRRIAEVLEAGGIPCQFASRQLLTEDPAVAGLVALVRVVDGGAGLIELEAALAWVPDAPGRAAVGVFKHWCYAGGLSLEQGLQQAVRLPVDGLSVARQRRLVAALERIKALQGKTKNLNLGQKVAYLIENTKLSENLDPLPEVLARLVADCADPGEFVTRVALATDADIYDARAERVALLSLHAAKGLEFPVVFIAGCEDGHIPLRRPGVSVDLAEERRLFYVGMTRASQALYLCAVRGSGNPAGDGVLSPFIGDISAGLRIDENPAPPAPRRPRQTQMSLF
jgi:uncharacterized protein (TIGR00375 family)